MGWDYCYHWKKKSDVLKEQLDPKRFGQAGYKLIAYQSVSEGYLAVWEKADGTRWLETTLVQKSGDHFGVKTMSEDEGPFDFLGAAEVLFSLVGSPKTPDATDFRERVRNARKDGQRARLWVLPTAYKKAGL